MSMRAVLDKWGTQANSQVYFIPQRGWSVISDIDDTVKVTNTDLRPDSISKLTPNPSLT